MFFLYVRVESVWVPPEKKKKERKGKTMTYYDVEKSVLYIRKSPYSLVNYSYTIDGTTEVATFR